MFDRRTTIKLQSSLSRYQLSNAGIKQKTTYKVSTYGDYCFRINATHVSAQRNVTYTTQVFSLINSVANNDLIKMCSF